MKSLLLIAAVCVGVLPDSVLAQSSSPTFQVDRLSGNSLSEVTLKNVTPEGIDVDAGGTATSIPLSDVEQLRRTERPAEPDEPFLPVVALQNGSQFGGTGLKVARRTLELTTGWGGVSFPIGEVRWLRVAAANDKLEAAWEEMIARDSRNDLLVVVKGEALDFAAGVVGDITDKEVKLLVKEREIAVARERMFGVVYARQPAGPPPLCEVALASGDRLRVTELSVTGDKLAVKFGATKASLPLSEVAVLDFTLGKIKALADLPMTQTQFAKSPLLTSASFEVRKNRNSLGKTLRIGNREFPRGLWMHSGTSATFRLGREYRRLTATIGLDSNSTELPRIAPRVKLVISGDGKTIETREVAWDDAPAAIELDVAGVRELEVRVESPRDMPGVLEHLVLGEARVIK
jgi:hypothetical protein